ncbi:hypothetical protein IWW50_006365 [Coemansia erecta]|nr:hypothetical protein IWW50_006365 [Coemansia erecta]
MASVVPAQPRFATHKALYAIDEFTSEATKLTSVTGWSASDEASLLSILVLHHHSPSVDDSTPKRGMVWVWAQVTPPKTRATGTMPNLTLAMPGRPRASATQLVGSNDSSADTARRLAARLKRPVFVSLVGTQRTRAQSMTAVAAEHMDELMTVERCLVAELTCALNK